MAVALNRYPRGYAVPTDKPSSTGALEFVDVKADPEIKRIYEDMMFRSASRGGWDFEQRVVKRCSQLFGNFEQWLRLQLIANDSVYDLNLEFLFDTVDFITTGKRRYDLKTWRGILQENPEPIIGVANETRFAKYRATHGVLTNYMGHWCSQKEGILDMLCTAEILFCVTNQISEVENS